MFDDVFYDGAQVVYYLKQVLNLSSHISIQVKLLLSFKMRT